MKGYYAVCVSTPKKYSSKHESSSLFSNIVKRIKYKKTLRKYIRQGRVKCPYCGSYNTARCLWGYSGEISKELRNKLASGEAILVEDAAKGETVVTNRPSRKCHSCRKQFGKAPLYESKANGFEDYRDIVQYIELNQFSFLPGPSNEMRIQKSTSGATVIYKEHQKSQKKNHITEAQWIEIVDNLFSKCFLHEWRESYYNAHVIDGVEWSIELGLTQNRSKTFCGHNAFPPYYGDVRKILHQCAGTE